MIIDQKSLDHHDIKTRLYEMVSLSKISSLEMICESTGIDEDSARELLQELVNQGTIDGIFSEDGRRFFLSNVKTSDAPVIPRNDDNVESKQVNTKAAKAVGLLGFSIIIIGLIFRGLTNIHQGIENAGVALFMIGIVVMTVGCIQFSRYNPPENLRR